MEMNLVVVIWWKHGVEVFRWPFLFLFWWKHGEGLVVVVVAGDGGGAMEVMLKVPDGGGVVFII